MTDDCELTTPNKPKPKSAKKNYIYNLTYQIFALITPLITTPYISRVLGSYGVGQYAFTYSIVSYFILFGALGFGIYAQREIARNQGNKVEQTKVFWEILIARLLSVIASLLIHISIILFGVYGKDYSILMWILTIDIASTAFDVAFIYQGNEEFGLIALRNIFIKIIGIILIFVFVRNESHVWLYALCQSIILIVSNLSLWTRLPKMLTKVSAKELKVKRHFVPTLRLFVPTIAISVYTILDKTLIGFIVPGETIIDGAEKKIADVENGYYDQADKIVKMAMTIITSLGTVMIPRNSQAIASGNYEELKANVNKALLFVFFLGIPIMFGVAAIAFNFSPWFFGKGFEKVPYLIMTLSPMIMIIGMSNVLGIQYLLPKKEDTKYTIAIVSGAAMNLMLNIVLIFFLWSFGACIATIASELVVTILMLIFARKDISFLKTIKTSWKCILSGLIMFGAVFVTQLYLKPAIYNTLLLICEGIAVYFVLLIILKERFLFSLFDRMKKKKCQQ